MENNNLGLEILPEPNETLKLVMKDPIFEEYTKVKFKQKCLEAINKTIISLDEFKEQVSDGYHTFKELYEFRMMYNAALFNEWGNPNKFTMFLDEKEIDGIGTKSGISYNVHKSWKHYDGELCFGGGWFIVSAKLPTGLISNHYEAKYWDLFKIPEVEKALFEFDGHTGQDVLERLKQL